MNSTILPGVPDARALQYLVLLSAVLPYLLSVIQQRHWSDAVRSRVAVALCFLVSGGILGAEGGLSLANWLTSSTLLFTLTATIYHRFAKANGAATLESVTTLILQAWTGQTPRESETPASDEGGDNTPFVPDEPLPDDDDKGSDAPKS